MTSVSVPLDVACTSAGLVSLQVILALVSLDLPLSFTEFGVDSLMRVERERSMTVVLQS